MNAIAHHNQVIAHVNENIAGIDANIPVATNQALLTRIVNQSTNTFTAGARKDHILIANESIDHNRVS